MKRIQIKLPGKKTIPYRNLDLIHDALVHGLSEAGAQSEELVGPTAESWNFAVQGSHKGKAGQLHTVVLSTPSQRLASVMEKLKTEDIRYVRVRTGESIDFSEAELIPVPDPVRPGSGALGCLMLSPLAVHKKEGNKKRWISNLNEVDLSSVVNRRLSKLADREVNLTVQPDSLYLRLNPKHSVLVSVKQTPNGRNSFVIGMQAPLLLTGSEQDLRLAWYAGIGEKTRNGFGCLGLIEKGVGR